MLTHGNIVANAMNMLAAAPFDTGHRLHARRADVPSRRLLGDVQRDDGGRHALVRAGASIRLTVLQTIRSATRDDTSMLVPTMISMMVDRPAIAELRPDVAASAASTAARRSPKRCCGARSSALPGVRLHAGLRHDRAGAGRDRSVAGATTTRPKGRELGQLRAAGRAALGVEIRIVDDEDREVPRGTVGRDRRARPNVMQGYWNQPDADRRRAARTAGCTPATAATWTTTGFVFVVDRIKDMIITGGENVYSAEVENAICSAPGGGDVRGDRRARRSSGASASTRWSRCKPGQTTTEAEIIGALPAADRRLQVSANGQCRAPSRCR